MLRVMSVMFLNIVMILNNITLKRLLVSVSELNIFITDELHYNEL